MSRQTASPRSRTRGRRQAPSAPGADLTIADLAVLGLLSERPMHGYELLREYARQDVADWAAVSRPHVYYALKKLAARGLIAAIGDGLQDKRGRSVFEVTATGTGALTAALANPGWATSRPPAPFTTWLGLSIHAKPGDTRRVIEARRAFLGAEVERERRTLKAIKRDFGSRVRVAAAMVSLALRQFETELVWLVELENALEQP